MEQKAKKAISGAFEAIGGNADVRGMGLAKSQVLHPIISNNVVEVDGKQQLECLHTADANGRAFLYVDTEEGVRLSTSQLTRRGNGLNLQAPTQAEAFEEWLDGALAKAPKKCTLVVKQLYSRELSDGNITRSAVFEQTFA